MLRLLSSCGFYVVAPDEVLAKRTNEPIEQPGGSAGCPLGKEPFIYHPPTRYGWGTFDR
jgi:hypothetical protein